MHKRITVVLSEEEYTQIRKNAGLVPLSRFLKNLGLAEAEEKLEQSGPKYAAYRGHRVEDVPRAEALPAAKRRGGRVERVSASIDSNAGQREDQRNTSIVMPEAPRVVLTHVNEAIEQDLCSYEYCHHPRKIHGHKYCSAVDCRCGGFE